MQIDWFTVIAQIINFLFLVWLLKRFLYGPILKAVDERELRVTSQLKKAEMEIADASRLQDELTKKNEDFDRAREGMMTQTKEEVEQQRNTLLEDARKEAGDLRLRLEEAVRAEQEQAEKEHMQRIGQEVFAITEKTLNDLANMGLGDQMILVFTKRLLSLKNDQVRELQAALNKQSGPLLVRSAFELNRDQRTSLTDTLKQVLAKEVTLRFDVEPALIAGIELVTNGYAVSWNISEYLSSLKEEVLGHTDASPYTENKTQTDNDGV